MASSSTSIPRSYDVFLSFRGEDTRRSFSDHLYSNLVAYGIHTFRDDEELQKGGDIASDLSKAIQESRIFLIIFSKNYAQSSWCLNELVKIMETMMQTQKESRAIPVFYHVNPSDVRKQLGSFGDAFACHERDAEKKEMIQKWRTALKKAADLSGYHLDDQKFEAAVIQKIREDIIKGLDRKPLFLGDNIVGMSFHLRQVEPLIKIESDEVRMIGIYGIGGIGKTTIAMAIYNDISSQFDGSSFLRVGEKSKGHLLKLQKKLLRDILKGEKPKFDDPIEGINVIKERLCSKRVLIILDDVDEIKELENLTEKYWFGPKSRIIVTTKNIQLLALRGMYPYEVKALDHKGSIELFNWFAFKQNIPSSTGDYEILSNKVVRYASGLPIALKVFGQFLYGRTKSEWKSALYQLEKTPKEEVQSVLKVSYDKLEDYEKSIFLDIACFFGGGVAKDLVSRILGEGAEIGIKVLHDRCLISISDNRLEMHDLLQRMGREIVRQQCPKEAGGRSRLWDFNDVESVLTKNTGTEAIEVVYIDTSSDEAFEELINTSKMKFTTEVFKKMNRLRLLEVNDEDGFIQVSNDLEFPSYELRYLNWFAYPLKFLPTNFYAKNLVQLTLIGGNIKQLWRRGKFDKLKVVDLSYSRDLIEIPYFSSMPNLEILNLQDCKSLERLPSDFCELKFLQELSCGGCSMLESFPEMTGDMKKLRKIDLYETGVKEMPSSIGLLNALECLYLPRCKNLESIQENIFNLSSLKTLDIFFCPNMSCEWGCFSGLCSLAELSLDGCNLKQGVIRSDNCLSSLKRLSLSHCLMEEEILNHICHLSSLQELSLPGNHFSSIPAAISQLSNLRVLGLMHCEQLLQIPELPPNLRLLDAHGCLSSSPSLLPFNSLLNCFKSECQVLESRLNRDWHGYSEYRGPGICITIPGICGIPEWIRDKRKGCEIEIELPKNWYENNDFLGFVISFDSEYGRGFCDLNIHGNDQSANMDKLEFGGYCDLCYDNWYVWVVYYPKEAIDKRYRSDQWTHIKVSFAPISETRGRVKECGVYLIDGCCSKCQRNVKCQGKLCLRGNTCSELPTIHHPSQVDSLCLRSCKNLETLPPSFCEFKSLTTLSCSGSSQLTRFSEILVIMENLRELHLGGTAIEELPSSIQHLRKLEYLNLQYCNNLVDLPESICHLKSLRYLYCSGCSQLKAFPEIMQIMGNLRKLKLSRTAIKELPSSIERLQGLQNLSLEHCNNLVNLPETICNLNCLQTLTVSFCSKLEKFPRNLGRLQCLENLGAAGLDWNLMQGATQNDVMASSETLNTSMNRVTSMLPSISELSKLRFLDLSHCHKLPQIPEFPSSLRTLDVHKCTNVENLSSPSSVPGFPLFKCFKSAIQEFESGCYWSKTISVLISGSNGIPKWIIHRKKGSEIIIELPWNWYQNNDFLGFALYSIYPPIGIESKRCCCELKCDLNFHRLQFGILDDLSSPFSAMGGLSSKYWDADDIFLEWRYLCCRICGESNLLWVTYYPKVAISKEYHSNEWRHLKASFIGCFGSKVKAEECGFDLIYAPR